MTPEALISLFMLAVSLTLPPGPNNVMLASSGANFGVRRTVPHIAGIMIGLPSMFIIVGFFLGQVFEASALLREAIRWLAVGVMLWLAWKIMTSGGISSASGGARPMRYYEAAAFQWINPKAWAMVIAVTAQFISGDNAGTVIPIVTLVFIGVGICSAMVWVGFGAGITRWLNTPGRLMWFNRAMALMIALSVLFLFGQ